MSHYYIRRIDAPNEVYAHGHAEPGKYGTIPPGFEEVEGPLPSNYVVVIIPTPSERLGQALAEALKDAPVTVRAGVRTIRTLVAEALADGDMEEVYYHINNFKAPPELEPLKEQLLAMLEEANNA